MKYAKMMVAVLLTLAFVAALLSGCSEQAKEAGEITDYDSQAFIPVGDSSDTSSKEPTDTTQTGGFVVSEKTYDFEENNLVVLNVENQTDKNYKITINGQYLDKTGEVLMEESRTYEGFSAGWSNYFFFVPEISFDKFSYTLQTEEYDGECYAKSFQFLWDLEESARGQTEEDISRSAQELKEYQEAVARGESNVPYPKEYNTPCIVFGLGIQAEIIEDVSTVLDVMILNHKGEVIAIKPEWYRTKVEAAYRDGDGAQWSGKYFYFFSDPDNREWPEDLKNDLTVLIGVKAATKFKLP